MEQEALVDSGADESLIDRNLALKLNLSLIPLLSPIHANALDGRLLFTVTHCTETVKMKAEKCEFHASTVLFLGFIISKGQS